MNFRIVLAVLFTLCGFRATLYGAENVANTAPTSEVKPWVSRVAFGILLHDVGFISDQKEHGVDPNWEMQFNPPEWKWWRWVGSPSAMLGATPNFNGYTSAFYLGLAWEASLSNRFLDNLTNDFTKRLWISGGVSTAVHTGPLHKDETLCRVKSDCGFGSRVLPRIQLELGVNFWNNHAISLFFDHMSHGRLGCSCLQNEGIDHTGLRYHFSFNKPPSSDITKKQTP